MGCKVPGVHDPLDPEYTILKQRLARRVRYEELDPQAMTLADMTAVAERTITDVSPAARVVWGGLCVCWLSVIAACVLYCGPCAALAFCWPWVARGIICGSSTCPGV
jgi:hypothetical protein